MAATASTDATEGTGTVVADRRRGGADGCEEHILIFFGTVWPVVDVVD